MSSGNNNKDNNLRRGNIEVEKAERIEVAEDTRIRSIVEHLDEKKGERVILPFPFFFFYVTKPRCYTLFFLAERIKRCTSCRNKGAGKEEALELR